MSGLLLLVPVAGCGMFDSGPSPNEVASAFVRSFAAGEHAAAASNTDVPQTARQALRSVRQNLEPQSVRATVRQVSEGEGDAPTRASFDVRWDFGNGRVWKYQSSMELIETEQDWKVRWAPSVIHPKLQAGQSLNRSEQRPEPAPVLDRNGVPLLAPEELVTVSMDPTQVGDLAGVAGTLAQALGTIDPQITQQSILAGAKDTPQGQAYTVATLRRASYEQVKPQIYDVPGVRFPTQTDLVAAKPDYGAQILAGISKKADEQVAGRAGWSITTADARGAQVDVLHEVAPKPASAMNSTLSDDVQTAAEQAVDPLSKGAMLVAMRPSNGEVLAVAQNAAADAQGPVALTGQYPPGSTFKIVTAAAALQSGKVDIDTPVQCPAKKTFDGRAIPNDHDFALGTIPVLEAFAQSCNTTFAQLAVDQPPDALTRAARQLGIGVDFNMPGGITITGKVPPAENTVQRAENGIGQGKVLASPFGMALATASVARGSMPTPTLIKGMKTTAKSNPTPPTPEALEQLRPMMREVVNSGTATQLAGSGEVAGKTGTAQFGDGTHSHGWFVGYRGDLAFSVLLVDGGSSSPAVDTARDFLEGLP